MGITLRTNIRGIACVIFIVALIAALYIDHAVFQPVQFVALNVGQGDSLYLHAQGGYDVLIDGGPDSTVLSRLSRHMPFYDHTIELAVLTHTDADHLFGLVEVARRYHIRRFVWNGIPRPSATLDTLLELLQKQGTDIAVFHEQQRFTINGDLTIDLLGPTPEILQGTQPLNERSIIARVSHGGQSLFAGGDAGFPAEEALIQNQISVRSTILKVGHHGSKTATSVNFLAAVNPTTAVISVGQKNRYGHPSAETLDRLNKVGATIRRTDQEGDVVIKL